MVQLHMSVARQPLGLPKGACPPVPAKRHSWRDEFGAPWLACRWVAPRRLCEASVSLCARPGWLTLTGNRYTLLDEAPTVFLGTRLRHHQVTVRSRLHFHPQQEGEEAGLAVRLNERGHFTLGVRRIGAALNVVASVTDQGSPTELASIPLTASVHRDECVELRTISDAHHFALSYAVRPGVWITLAAVPAFVVSPERNGGFTGALIGMYAALNSGGVKLPSPRTHVVADEAAPAPGTPAYFKYFAYDGM
jgi:alpha-N-arabinofuranosidase